MSNSYGTDASSQKALDLVERMKDCFLRFKEEHERQKRPPSAESARSSASVNSIRSQRFVKIKRSSIQTEKDQMISKLQAENKEKDLRI